MLWARAWNLNPCTWPKDTLAKLPNVAANQLATLLPTRKRYDTNSPELPIPANLSTAERIHHAKPLPSLTPFRDPSLRHDRHCGGSIKRLSQRAANAKYVTRYAGLLK